MENLLKLLIPSLAVYFFLRNKSEVTQDNIYSTIGYVAPEQDVSTTQPIKANPATSPAVTVTKTSTTATGQKKTEVKTEYIKLPVRNRVQATQTVNLRSYKFESTGNSYPIIRTAYVGEILGTYVTKQVLTISGNQKGTFILVKGNAILSGLEQYFYVLESATKMVV